MDAYRELKMIVPTPHMVDDIQDEEELKRFVEAYRLLAKIILRLKHLTSLSLQLMKLEWMNKRMKTIKVNI